MFINTGMLKVNQLVGFAGGLDPNTFKLRVKATSSGSSGTIIVPVQVAAGDLVIVWNTSSSNSSKITPSGFTEALWESSSFLLSSQTYYRRAYIGLRAWQGSETRFYAGLSSGSWAVVVFQGPFDADRFRFGAVTKTTSRSASRPDAHTIPVTSFSSNTPLIALGCQTSRNAPSISPAMTEIRPSSGHGYHYRTFGINDTLTNINYGMSSNGHNGFIGSLVLYYDPPPPPFPSGDRYFFTITPAESESNVGFQKDGYGSIDKDPISITEISYFRYNGSNTELAFSGDHRVLLANYNIWVDGVNFGSGDVNNWTFDGTNTIWTNTTGPEFVEGQSYFIQLMRPGVSPWHPSELNPHMWYDAADSTKTISATPISRWNDLSGNGNHLYQNNAALQPIYNSVNRWVDFDGSNDQMRATQSFFSSGNNPFTVFSVLRIDTNQLDKYFLGQGREGTNRGFAAGWNYASNRPSLAFNGNDVAGGTFSTNQDYIRGDIYAPGRRSITLNGTTAASDTNSNWNMGAFEPAYVGDLGYLSRNFDGKIRTILIFRRELPLSERQIVEGYLAWRWDLVSYLPSGHPYKSSAPDWDPSESDPFSWYDAELSEKTVSATPIGQWNDISGNNRHLIQTVHSSRPLYSEASQEVVFDGTDDNMVPVGFPFFASGNSPFTVATVMKWNVNTRDKYFIGQGTISSGFTGVGLGTANNEDGRSSMTFANGSDIYGSTYQLDRNYIGTYRYTPGSAAFWLDGTLSSTSGFSSLNMSSVSPAVGSWAASRYFGGALKTVMVFRNAITSMDRQRLEGWLAWKWDMVGSLPVDHPYKREPPFSSAIPDGQFTMMRLTVTGVGGGTGVQLAEIHFADIHGVEVSKSDALAEGPWSAANEEPFRAIDDSIFTKWYAANPLPRSLTVEFPYPIAPTKFTYTTANDSPARDPRRWILEGSKTGENWVVLHEQTTDYVPIGGRYTKQPWFEFQLEPPPAPPEPDADGYAFNMTTQNAGINGIGYSNGSLGSISNEPVPGKTLNSVVSTTSSTSIVFEGDLSEDLNGYNVWIDGINHGAGNPSWEYISSPTARFVGHIPMFEGATAGITTKFTTPSLGAIDGERRHVIVAVHRFASTNQSMTIDGASALKVEEISTVEWPLAFSTTIYAAECNKSGSIEIDSVATSSNATAVSCSIWVVDNLPSADFSKFIRATITSQSSSAASLPIQTVEGGTVISCAFISSESSVAMTWSGINKDFENSMSIGSTTISSSGASIAIDTGGNRLFTCSYSTSASQYAQSIALSISPNEIN